MSLLASQWTTFPLPQSGRHMLVSVLDAHGVEANAQTHLPIQGLLVLRVLYLDEYLSHSCWAVSIAFLVLFILLILMRKHHSLLLLFTIVTYSPRPARHAMIIYFFHLLSYNL